MSKETFSKKISDMMYFKMKVLENMNYSRFLEKDEYFEFILCLSYMTLSKEKIIKKEIKNKKRLDRLTRMVLETDVDKVFQNGFSKKMPIINYATEMDNTWILDNIRDSIMHGVFDIDEENEMIIINNEQHDRKLKANVPFSWFIDYAKYDILSKKIMDKYTVKGFYYDKQKKNCNYLNTRKELFKNILYVVNIDGNVFNVNEIEKRVRELFNECSINDNKDLVIDDKMFDYNKDKYNNDYLLSFCKTCSIVKKTIEKEYPGVNVNIHIDNRKYKLINKISKKTYNYYNDYDFMFDHFNSLVSSKSMSFLKYLSNLIENIDCNFNEYSGKDIYETMNLINYVLKGEFVDYKNKNDIYNCFNDNMNILKNVCLNVYGLSTLVINHENLYNSLLLNSNPSEYNLFAYSKQKYLKYADQEKDLIGKIFGKEIKLYEKNEQLSKCSDKKGIEHLTKEIEKLESDKKNIQEELENLKFKPFVSYYKKNDKEIEKVNSMIDCYYGHFYKANSVDAKRKILKLIKKWFDKKKIVESEYMYGICDNMGEVITIIRNSLAHIGRMNVNKKSNCRTIISLCDYDTDNSLSGYVVGDSIDFIKLFDVPFVEQKNKLLIK